ncbi:Alpha/Beta hydrolase protein [Mycena crocata]|nr:Alpha/Beta hydrolase protein [Mycena crocata]
MRLLQRSTLAALLVSVPLITTAAGPVVDLGYARYQGAVNASTNVTTFVGIRYAAAPIDKLRFSEPQPPQHVAGVQQAIALPDMCPQAPVGSSSTNPVKARALEVGLSEDCLTLSVAYPSDAEGTATRHLPVMVFIHGGGWVNGYSSMYRGSDLVAQSKRGVVAVIIQYRLGLFGFLPGTAVKEGGALNAGLLDQQFALRWVNKHIAKFGGDPSKVTIWGESAGAGSVLEHVIANGGNTKPQLFRAAITSSAVLPPHYKYNDRIPELLYSQVVAQTNCTQAANSLACLRAANTTVLQKLNIVMNAASFYTESAFFPVVDGEFIRQRPTLALSAGRVNGKALLSVTNSNEAATLVDPNSVNATNYAFEVFPNLNARDAARVGALYSGLGTQLFQSTAIFAEAVLICPTQYLLSAFRGHAFKAEFAIPPAIHALDVFVYFPSTAIDVPEIAEAFGSAALDGLSPALLDAFRESFTSFAISLNPNVKVDPANITPPWAQWEAGSAEMVFNTTETGTPAVKAIKTDEGLLERCRFWHSLAAETNQ